MVFYIPNIIKKMTANELAVLSALDNSNELYGLEIMERIGKVGKGLIFKGSIYSVLRRLETRGFLESRWGESAKGRGDYRRRYYKMTGLGAIELKDKKLAFLKLWGFDSKAPELGLT